VSSSQIANSEHAAFDGGFDRNGQSLVALSNEGMIKIRCLALHSLSLTPTVWICEILKGNKVIVVWHWSAGLKVLDLKKATVTQSKNKGQLSD